MGEYLISVIDLKKPIIREDIIVDKEIIDVVMNKPDGLGLLLEDLILKLREARKKQKKEEMNQNANGKPTRNQNSV